MTDETKNVAREALMTVIARNCDYRSGDIADAILASPALDAIVAERVAALAEEMPSRMADAWGGDSRWLTTGSNVAALVGDWLREEAAALTERTAER